MSKPKPKRSEKTLATLTMVVTYESLPSTSDLDEVIEKARELGSVDLADLVIHHSVKTSLI